MLDRKYILDHLDAVQTNCGTVVCPANWIDW